MNDLTLEGLAKRIEVIELQLAAQRSPKKDWRRVVGISDDNEFTRAMLAEIEAQRDAERKAAEEAIPNDSPRYRRDYEKVPGLKFDNWMD